MLSGQNRKSNGKHFQRIKGVYYLCASILLISLAVLNITVFLTRENQIFTFVLPENPKTEINYWKTLLENYPTYKDGWIKLSEIEYRLGNINDARKYLKTAEEIDPSDETVNSLKQKYDL